MLSTHHNSCGILPIRDPAASLWSSASVAPTNLSGYALGFPGTADARTERGVGDHRVLMRLGTSLGIAPPGNGKRARTLAIHRSKPGLHPRNRSLHASGTPWVKEDYAGLMLILFLKIFSGSKRALIFSSRS